MRSKKSFEQRVQAEIPMLPCLSITECMKLFLFVLTNILSWGAFFIGTLLGGKEIRNYLRHPAKK